MGCCWLVVVLLDRRSLVERRFNRLTNGASGNGQDSVFYQLTGRQPTTRPLRRRLDPLVEADGSAQSRISSLSLYGEYTPARSRDLNAQGANGII